MATTGTNSLSAEQRVIVESLESDTTVSVGTNVVLPAASGYGLQVDASSPTFGWRDIIGNVQPKATDMSTKNKAPSFYA